MQPGLTLAPTRSGHRAPGQRRSHPLICALLLLAGLLVAAPAMAQELDALLTTATLPLPERPALMVDSVRLEGVRVGRRSPMRARITVQAGSALDEQAIEDSRLRLLETGLCESVTARLDKGAERGRVEVVFTCVERVTTSIDAIHLGHARPTRFWAGAEVSDLDPFGQQLGLGAGAVSSGGQTSARLSIAGGDLIGIGGNLRISLFYLDGREAFVGPEGQGIGDAAVGHIPVDYTRGGIEAGFVLDVAPFTRWALEVRPELLLVDPPPDAYQVEATGAERPFEFNADPDIPATGMIRTALTWDRRDDPAWPTRGQRAAGVLRAGYYQGPWAALAGRFEQYLRLPLGTVLRVDAFLGGLAGGAPFYERYFVGDLHTYIPARALDLNFARRRGPNLIKDGHIARARYETVAGRLGVEYRVPLGAGPAHEPYGVEFFIAGGLLSMASPGEPGAFDGGPPFDVTVDVGLRFETEIGVMGLSVGNLFLLVDP